MLSAPDIGNISYWSDLDDVLVSVVDYRTVPGPLVFFYFIFQIILFIYF